MDILLIYRSVSSFENTTTRWLVWLFVTLVRQLGSDRLKARPVITTVANAQTFDPCVGPSCDYNPSLWKQAGLKSFASTCPITCVSHMISVKALTEVRSCSRICASAIRDIKKIRASDWPKTSSFFYVTLRNT